MNRACPILLGMLLPACAGGEQWRITDSTTTLGEDEEGEADTQGETGPVISESASVSVSASASASGSAGPTTSESSDATDATTDPKEESTSTGEDDSTTTSGSSDPTTSSTTTFDDSSTTGAPIGIDLSGWSIVQTDSARTFDIPDGTVVPFGGVLIVARDSDEAAFEDYWGVAFGPDVVFITTANDFPTINGDETYAVRNASGVTVDGPSPALAEGEALDRVDPEADDGWVSAVADVGTPTPGTSTEPPASFRGVFVSEVSDANGNGNFVYEFVELRAF